MREESKARDMQVARSVEAVTMKIPIEGEGNRAAKTRRRKTVSEMRGADKTKNL